MIKSSKVYMKKYIMNIAVFINPFSGKAIYGFFSEERFVEIFKKYLSPEHSFSIVETTSPADVPKKIREIMDYDVVAIVGGDGTIKSFIDIFIPLLIRRKKSGQSFPLIIPIGGGSMNVIQKNILPSQTTGIAPRVICDLVNSFKRREDIPPSFIKKVKVLQFSEFLGSEKKVQWGFMFGNGAIFKGLQIYYSRGVGSQSALSLFFEFIYSAFSGKGFSQHIKNPINAEIYIDGWKFPYDRVLGCLGSVFKKMILFTQPFVSERFSDSFYFIAFADDVFRLALNFPFIILGRKVLEKTFNGTAKVVEMKFEGGFTIDGEVFERTETHLKIELGPEIEFLSFPK